MRGGGDTSMDPLYDSFQNAFQLCVDSLLPSNTSKTEYVDNRD